jgi:hypothetical protein
VLPPYFPGGILNALASPREGSTLHIASIHRLQRGLQGYLILFAPHAFVPQCQGRPSDLPSLLVFPTISTDFTPTPSVPITPNALKSSSIESTSKVKPMRFNFQLTKPPTDPLRPINPGNAWGFCLTAPAGTELGSPYSYGTVNNFLPYKRTLHPEGLHHSRNVAPSDFRPLRKILDCSLP